jgi:tetratricopeptide (TPR) repeat protein
MQSSSYPEQLTSMPPSSEEPFSAPRGRRVGGWIVALVLMMAVGVVGWAVAKPYLLGRNAQAEAQVDPRALSFLTESEKAMADGNLESAKQAVAKASALAESNPRVLLDEARVAAAEADIPWLKMRLLAPDAAEDIRTTKADVDERVTRARRAADAAVASAPDDTAAIRARVDALRLSGEQEAARGYVAKIIAQASQPETAYVLAALDLAEAEPLWKTVVERLRLAAAGEGNAGRARAALVYALAKSGDAAGAKAELAKLDALTRPYPDLPALHAFVDHGSSKVVADAGAPAASGRPTSGTGPAPQGAGQGASVQAAGGPTDVSGGGGAGNGGGDAIPTDPRVAIQAAAMAVKTGQLVRARQIYESIVTRNPGDSEALAGLGDIARLDGDPPLAISRYKRAIAVNPSYLPALLGLADTQWSSGDKGSAVHGYSEIVDRFPEGTYPAYVKQRSESGVAAPAATAGAKGSGGKTTGTTE